MEPPRAEREQQPLVDLRVEALQHTNSLKTVVLPVPSNFSTFVRDRVALRRAGKALFWDRQVGSDGQACASCHFHAGADNRSRNQLNPGMRSTLFPGGDLFFTTGYGPNYQLTAADFPFHRVQNVDDRDSAVLFDNNDVVSSQGVHNAEFVSLRPPTAAGFPNDNGRPVANLFADAMVRNVEPRNTPTAINAVFNHRNFWDGRARNEFNGVNPLGQLEEGFVVKVISGTPRPVQVRINDSSAASQAVGPSLSDLEMSFGRRTLPVLGRKLLVVEFHPVGRSDIAAPSLSSGGSCSGSSRWPFKTSTRPTACWVGWR